MTAAAGARAAEAVMAAAENTDAEAMRAAAGARAAEAVMAAAETRTPRR